MVCFVWRQEEELKEIADKTLGEVRQSLSETKRALDTLNAVEKLRSARKHGLQQTGKISRGLKNMYLKSVWLNKSWFCCMFRSLST